MGRIKSDYYIDDEGVLKEVEITEEGEVIIPEKALYIDDDLFYGNDCVRRISSLNNSVVSIGQNAFSRCRQLTEVNFSQPLNCIKSGAFSFCSSLAKIDIPDSVEIIENKTFLSCENLKEITFSNSLQYIGEMCFSNCTNLEEVHMPNSLTNLGVAAFRTCQNLKSVNLSDNIERLEETFYECSRLKDIKLPKNLKELGANVFTECFSLEKVLLPEKLEIIGSEAFLDCRSLKEIKIPSSVQYIGEDAFANCRSLRTIRLNNYSNLHQEGILSNLNKMKYYYLDKNSKEIVLSCDIIEDSNNYEKINYIPVKKYLNCSKEAAIIISTLYSLEELKKSEFKYLKTLLENISINNITKDNYLTIRDSLKNNKEFNNMLISLEKKVPFSGNEYKYYYLFKFAYNLGAFSQNSQQRKKVCDFIIKSINNKVLSFDNIDEMFSNMMLEFKEDWSKFIIDEGNFNDLIKLQNRDKDYISKVYNKFDNIKRFNQLNTNSEQITIDICNAYLKRPNFGDNDVNNEDILERAGKFKWKKDSYKEAGKIRDEYKRLREQGKLNDHLLEKELKEDIFANIDDIRKDILSSVRNAKVQLDELVSNKFTYEFISKYDADNFFLGNYCNFWNHLEGLGYSLVKGSILHPNCQNLVIRDEKGHIVASSTLFLNTKQRYGLLDHIKISGAIVDEKDKEIIYQKYLKAISTFANEYNKKNPDYPLFKINVGLLENDLKEKIIKNHGYDGILDGLDFSRFGKNGRKDSGNWDEEQANLWKNRGGKK